MTQQPQAEQPAQKFDFAGLMAEALDNYNADPGKFERESFERSKSVVPVVPLPEGWNPIPLNPDGSLQEEAQAGQ